MYLWYSTRKPQAVNSNFWPKMHISTENILSAECPKMAKSDESVSAENWSKLSPKLPAVKGFGRTLILGSNSNA